MAVFKAFKPEAMNKIAQSMGFSGNMREFESFIEQDPARQARMKMFEESAMQMAKGWCGEDATRWRYAFA